MATKLVKTTPPVPTPPPAVVTPDTVNDMVPVRVAGLSFTVGDPFDAPVHSGSGTGPRPFDTGLVTLMETAHGSGGKWYPLSVPSTLARTAVEREARRIARYRGWTVRMRDGKDAVSFTLRVQDKIHKPKSTAGTPGTVAPGTVTPDDATDPTTPA